MKQQYLLQLGFHFAACLFHKFRLLSILSGILCESIHGPGPIIGVYPIPYAIFISERHITLGFDGKQLRFRERDNGFVCIYLDRKFLIEIKARFSLERSANTYFFVLPSQVLVQS